MRRHLNMIEIQGYKLLGEEYFTDYDVQYVNKFKQHIEQCEVCKHRVDDKEILNREYLDLNVMEFFFDEIIKEHNKNVNKIK